MIPLCIPNISSNEGKYLQECVDSSFVSSVGKFVSQFEEMISVASNSKLCVATNSGTTALHLALKTIGVEHGDLVILPSFTFIASANSISHCGATPLLVDVDSSSWTICPKLLKDLLENQTYTENEVLYHSPTKRPIKAIMPVYTLGMPADMDSINELAKKFNIPVIADAAAAIGATYKNQPLADFAKLSVFSFNGNKTITAGGGGAIIGNNKEIMTLAKHLSTTARVGKDYDHDLVGFNYRLTNIQAAVGCAQIEKLDEFIKRKREIDALYRSSFQDSDLVLNFPSPTWAQSSCWFSGVILRESYSKYTVSQICEKLSEKGIQTRSFWKPIHLQKPYANAPRTEMKYCESIWDRILTLPCSTNLSNSDQLYVINTLKELL